MSKYTSGPWQVARRYEYFTINNIEGHTICIDGDFSPFTQEIREANAALIAAAPDTAAERDRLKAINAELLKVLERWEREFVALAESRYGNAIHNNPPALIIETRAIIAEHKGGGS